MSHESPLRSSLSARFKGFVRAALLVSALTIAHAAGAQEVAPAQVLFDEGVEALDRGELELAVKKLAESQRLDPGIGTLLRLARAYDGLHRTASAWAALKDARDLAEKRQDTARLRLVEQRIAALGPRLSFLRVRVADRARIEGLKVWRNEELVGDAQWDVDLPFDPGEYVFKATAPGRKPWSAKVRIDTEGATIDVVIPLLEPEPPKPEPAKSEAGATAKGHEKDATPSPDLSHASQFGLAVRADIDPQLRGMAATIGLSYGIGPYFEVAAGAVLGANSGFFADAKGYLLRGAWKPLALAGVEAFVVNDGVYPGLHGAAGLQWDPVRHFGVMAAIGVLWLPETPAVPDDEPSYEPLYFVPSIGVQGRL
ncbi:MAG: hypothetical protein R3B70_38035 [Polyangiaceae bacterium]